MYQLHSEVISDLANAVDRYREHADRITSVVLDDISTEGDVLVGASFTISFEGAADSAVILGEL